VRVIVAAQDARLFIVTIDALLGRFEGERVSA
jgi:hypothetical protein